MPPPEWGWCAQREPYWGPPLSPLRLARGQELARLLRAARMAGPGVRWPDFLDLPIPAVPASRPAPTACCPRPCSPLTARIEAAGGSRPPEPEPGPERRAIPATSED